MASEGGTVGGPHGWVSYGPLHDTAPLNGSPAGNDLRPEFADLGRLARRGMRAVVAAARVEDGPQLSRILTAHLGPDATGFDVVEETWPGYDHVNVQAGLDAWLPEGGRTWELVGLLAATRDPDGALTVSADDLRAALDELLDTRNAMTRTLLGGAGA